MPQEREIIYRLRKGQSIRSISEETRTHRRDIRKLRSLAETHGWLDPENNLPDDQTLRRALNELRTDSGDIKETPLNAYRAEIERWLEEGISFVVMKRLLAGRYDCDESTIRRYVHREFPKWIKPVIQRDTIPGEIMEVDFGQLGYLLDDAGIRRRAFVFSGRLRHSSKAYRQIVYDQKQETFYACHIHAFEYFGGVPEKVVPDNLKAAVIKRNFHEAQINPAYLALAQYYGFMVSPTRARMPHHKGGVENDIKYIKRNFWPEYQETEHQLGHEIPRGSLIQSKLDEWSEEIAHKRFMRKHKASPEEIFNTEEAQALQPLPTHRYEIPTWAVCKVQRTWQIQFDKAYYSVPYRYIGKQVQICATAETVRIFHDFEEICLHSRLHVPYERSLVIEHAPPNQAEYMNMTRQGLLDQARAVGEHTYKLILDLLSDRYQDRLGSAKQILKLAGKYSAERLDLACRRAMYFGALSYLSIKHILQRGLEDQSISVESIEADAQPQVFRFARDKDFFNIDFNTSNDEGGSRYG